MTIMKKNILVTGATGFIGSHLLPILWQHDWQITTAVRNSNNLSKIPFTISKNVKVGEINSNTDWQESLEEIDTVIHLAARAHIIQEKISNSETEFIKVNTEGTINLVKQSIQAGVKHFIFISSIHAMTTQSNQILSETSPCQPDSPYGSSKLQAEQALINLAKDSNITWTIIRPTLVYGHGNRANMERLMKLVTKGLPLPFGAIKNRRSFVFVGNLVDAIVTCVNHPKAANQIFLVSDGEDVSTPELIRLIAQQMEQYCKIVPVPPGVLKFLGYAGDVAQFLSKKSMPLNTYSIDRLLGSLFVDSSHIQKTLSWQPPFTLEQGLAQTIRF